MGGCIRRRVGSASARAAIPGGRRFPARVSAGGRGRGPDPSTLPVTIFDGNEDAKRLLRYRDLEMARAVEHLPSAKEDEILPTLDRWDLAACLAGLLSVSPCRQRAGNPEETETIPAARPPYGRKTVLR